IAKVREVSDTLMDIHRQSYQGFSSQEQLQAYVQKIEQTTKTRAGFANTFLDIAQQRIAENISTLLADPNTTDAIILVDVDIDYAHLGMEAKRHLQDRVSEVAGVPPAALAARGEMQITNTMTPNPHYVKPYEAAERRLLFARRLHRSDLEAGIDWERVLFEHLVADAFAPLHSGDTKHTKTERNKALYYILSRIPQQAIRQFFLDFVGVYPLDDPERLGKRLDDLARMEDTRNDLLRRMEGLITMPPEIERLVESGQLDPMTMTVEQAGQFADPKGKLLTPSQRIELLRTIREVEESGSLEFDERKASIERQDIVRKLNILHERSNERRDWIRNMIEADLDMMEVYIAAAEGEERVQKQYEYNRLLRAYQTIDIEELELQDSGTHQFTPKSSLRLPFYTSGA
ncbi:MAG: hypothetical protein KGL95_08030, partial [Patescibacteria group bacterium]|nr:hypothetical protein [Patescibacteria group bacterium]